jgi:hypothetical protein
MLRKCSPYLTRCDTQDISDTFVPTSLLVAAKQNQHDLLYWEQILSKPHPPDS